MCKGRPIDGRLEEECGGGGDFSGKEEAPCRMCSSDPEQQHIFDAPEMTRGKLGKLCSWRGVEVYSVRVTGQILVLVFLVGLLLWRLLVIVSRADFPVYILQCLSLHNIILSTSWTLNIIAALVLFDFLLATGVGGWALLTQRRDTMTSSNTTRAAGEGGAGLEFPKVVVQLPMYNEREVYDRAIAAACVLDWPKDCLVIQVLDDSTEGDVSAGMQRSVAHWLSKGVNVRYRHRIVREGYKAGNLREGLLEPYTQACEYVAVLDADFEPEPDWLQRTVPVLQADPGLALVQTRWTFSNPSHCLLTRWQAIELKWHFMAEQLSGSHMMGFFGFNGENTWGGTWGGTWGEKKHDWGLGFLPSLKCVPADEDDAIRYWYWWCVALLCPIRFWRLSGDTLTEDMDMAMAAAARGWTFRMMTQVQCLSELPSTDGVYRKQQYRWACGPATLLRKHAKSVFFSTAMPLSLKLYSVGVYIFLRRILRPSATLLTFLFASLSLLFPSLFPLPLFPLLSLSLAPPLCYLVFSPTSLPHLPTLSLFVGAMALVRVRAITAGLCDWTSARLWTVTQKQGRSSHSPPPPPLPPPTPSHPPAFYAAKLGGGTGEWGLGTLLGFRVGGGASLESPLLRGGGGVGWGGWGKRIFGPEVALGSLLLAAPLASIFFHQLNPLQMGFAIVLALQGLAYVAGGFSLFGDQ